MRPLYGVVLGDDPGACGTVKGDKMTFPERRLGVWQGGWFQVLYGWACGDWTNPESRTEGTFRFYGVALGEAFIGVTR